jgi:hypothetical protein
LFFIYEISKGSFVSLKVCDVLGQELATLMNGTQAASRYSVAWNPAGAATGVYFCRLRARCESGLRGFTGVLKLLLLK